MRDRARGIMVALLTITVFVGLVWVSRAGVDEYGSTGPILGVSFTGGDGSYTRAVKDGITLGIVPDFPWTYQDGRWEIQGSQGQTLRVATWPTNP